MRYFFDNYAIDCDRRELRRDVHLVALEPQVFDLLVFLIRNRERVVTRDDLLASIWGGRIVSESALSTRINAARSALGDTGAEQRYIKTLPRKGVRFVGNVTEESSAATSAATAAPKPGLALPDRPSIAVLPFANMSGDPEQDYFADGITDDIITALSYWRWLFVIARNSTFAYKGIDVKRIGAELGVRYVLEGSVRRSADRVRITVQLVEVETRAHLWARRYDREIDDLFKLQDEITSAVSATVEPEIGASERDRSRRKPPENLGAWELFQRGMWHLLRHNSEDSFAAQSFFEKSIAVDPYFAPPHAAIAVVLFFRIARFWAVDHATVLDGMRKESSLAVEIDPKDSLAHTTLGLYFMERAHFAQSFSEHENALRLNANSPFAHWSYGYALGRADRFEDALKEFEIALRLNPNDPSNWQHLTLKAGTLYLLKRYHEAVACARDATQTPTADLLWPHVHHAAALGQLGRSEEAATIVAELGRLRPGLTISAFRSWPTNQNRSAATLAHIAEGLKKAGLPE